MLDIDKGSKVSMSSILRQSVEDDTHFFIASLELPPEVPKMSLSCYEVDNVFYEFEAKIMDSYILSSTE